jgi:hypothetical protein
MIYLDASLATLSSRTPFAWLRERDVDLLVCSELHAKAALADLFAKRVGAAGPDLVGAWVSHSEVDGESDLVIAFARGTQKIIALVENKIATSFQPEQPERYKTRAQRWALVEGVARVETILFAPVSYMQKSGVQAFNHRISYEDAAEALKSVPDARSAFLMDALEAGVRAYAQGYVMKPDQNATEMWMACWQTANRVAPALRMQKPGAKPGQSTWLYFRDAEGFSTEDRTRAVVVYKAVRGQVDLQFADTTPADLANRARSILDETMEVVRAAKSASFRVQVPKIDFFIPPETQRAEMIEGFAASERLRAFFAEHRETLLRNT